MQGRTSIVVVLSSRPKYEICHNLIGGYLKAYKSTFYGRIPEYMEGASALDASSFVMPCADSGNRIINSNINFYEQKHKF